MLAAPTVWEGGALLASFSRSVGAPPRVYTRAALSASVEISVHVQWFNGCHQYVMCALRETGSLPSAWIFVECILTGTRQKDLLPSVSRKTHGNDKTLCKR